jgi:hypothetical protein
MKWLVAAVVAVKVWRLIADSQNGTNHLGFRWFS